MQPGETSPRAVSRPTLRILAVLDFLTANPEESFGLTEIGRRVGLNKPTCHGILTTLARAGYLSQDPTTRSYRLGPSILAAGSAASVQLPMLDGAREEMRAIAEDLGLATSVLARARDQYVIVDRYALPDPVAEAIHIGLRLPFLAPLGAFFIAWSSPAEFDAWVASAGRSAAGSASKARAHLERSIAAVRSRGFDVTLATEAESEMHRELRRMHASKEAPDLQALGRRLASGLGGQAYQLDEIDPASDYAVSAMAAPLFGRASHPELALALGAPMRGLSGREILDFGARLVEGARRVTEAAGARFPLLKARSSNAP